MTLTNCLLITLFNAIICISLPAMLNWIGKSRASQKQAKEQVQLETASAKVLQTNL